MGLIIEAGFSKGRFVTNKIVVKSTYKQLFPIPQAVVNPVHPFFTHLSFVSRTTWVLFTHPQLISHRDLNLILTLIMTI